MNIFDKASVELILQHGINAGYWSIESLDKPPANYNREIIEARRSQYFGPTFNPPTPYRNLLRDHSTPETSNNLAQATSANEKPRNLDLHIGQRPSVPDQCDRDDLCSHKNPAADRADHGNQEHLGTTRQPSPPNARSICPSALEPKPSALVDAIPW